MKIKCFRFPCEVCGNGKVVSSIQVFFRKNGEVSYARARHLGTDKKFYYHQQSTEYVKEKLGDISNTDLGQSYNRLSIEQTETEKQPIIDYKSWGWELNPYITALQAVA